MKRADFRRGPKCCICRKRKADRGETVCFPCQSRLDDIDDHAANPLLIRRAMVRAGVPVYGMKGLHVDSNDNA